MIVCGFDPGTLHTGFGFVRKVGNRLHRLASGVVSTNPRMPMAHRLLTIREHISENLTACPPDIAAVEDIFFSKNAASALKLGQVRGVILVTLAERNIPISSLPPALVKRSVVGSGRAAKSQVQHVVKAILGLSELPKEDEADALAIAIAAANAAGIKLPHGKVSPPNP
jgi:crossover junction endodeoxyribonuclease RuvC